MKLGERLKHAWNAFTNRDPTGYYGDGGSYRRPDRHRMKLGNERSIATSVLNRIAMDVAAISFSHCKVDQNGRYVSTMDSGLNNCLNLEANIDQSSRAFIHDIALSMLDEGVVAVVPVETDTNPDESGSMRIYSMRVGKIIEWFPDSVRVELYDDRDGRTKAIMCKKKYTAIIENPLYAVINESNSTLQRLIRKLALLDSVDNQSASGKLDLIVQLPYVIKTKARRLEAERRRQDIEDQLQGTKYGIAYTDGSEKITQLNRPVENNLMKQIEYLTSMLYSQLGITTAVMDGTADEATMLNYYNRSIEPIVSIIALEFERKFLSKTARTQKQKIMTNRKPFNLLTLSNLAEIADKLTRNEIMSSNEFRQILGIKPSDDPKADQLVNSNMPQPQLVNVQDTSQYNEAGEDQQNTTNNEVDIDAERDKIFSETMDYIVEQIDKIIQNGDIEETDSLQQSDINGEKDKNFSETIDFMSKQIDSIIKNVNGGDPNDI